MTLQLGYAKRGHIGTLSAICMGHRAWSVCDLQGSHGLQRLHGWVNFCVATTRRVHIFTYVGHEMLILAKSILGGECYGLGVRSSNSHSHTP